MGWIYGQAQEKLAAYRLEATLRRQLPKNLWRVQTAWVQLARVLRGVSERLEPTPLLTVRTKL